MEISHSSTPYSKNKEIKVPVSNFNEASVAWCLSSLYIKNSSSIIYLGKDEKEIRRIQKNLLIFINFQNESPFENDCVHVFPSRDVFPYSFLSPSSDILGERSRSINFLRSEARGIFLTTFKAISEKIFNLKKSLGQVTSLKEGEHFKHEDLLMILNEMKYEKRSVVQSKGEFAVRGGIIDFFSPHSKMPTRIELKGDEIDSIKKFHPDTQRNNRSFKKAELYPPREILMSKEEIVLCSNKLESFLKDDSDSNFKIQTMYELFQSEEYFPGIENMSPLFSEDISTFFDFVPSNAQWIFADKSNLLSESEQFWSSIEEEFSLSSERGLIGFDPKLKWIAPDDFFELVELWPTLELETLSSDIGLKAEQIEKNSPFYTESTDYFRGRFDYFFEQIEKWILSKCLVVLVASDRTELYRIKNLLEARDIKVPIFSVENSSELKFSQLILLEGSLSAGLRIPSENILFFKVEDLFGNIKKRQTENNVLQISSEWIKELKKGDCVVHDEYGIGRFLGEVFFEDSEDKDEFMALEYFGGDRLYIPMHDLKKVNEYRGPDSPKLDKLDGIRWSQTKNKVRKSINEMVKDLVSLYAERNQSQGFQFKADVNFENEVNSHFEFEETPGQLQAINDVLSDMESGSPMDRLVCGDVGFGKTEVAIRAATRSISSGKQVGLVVPTTLLAHQHFEVFKERFKNLPVKVEMLSRFRTKKEQLRILGELSDSKIDILIGTHRILQNDVSFHNLGLLIVDEEHKFGVSHKEKFKKISIGVDVLTLTATPIPRTLQLALSGTRDLSVIETPPRDRLPPRTYICDFDEEVISRAIKRELLRGGQVFFVHNRISSLDAINELLVKCLPESKILVAHGQMSEKKLEEIMHKFVSREVDVLLSTSIVESGLDIPSVNTIIINRADRFGLAQLYQLRGRVGRDRHQAHVYLMVPSIKKLKGQEKERLQAIQDVRSVGQGFKIAMRDLEIRGSGNLLGHKQSGHIASVGFEMYCRILEEIVNDAKGITSRFHEPEIILPINGSMPSSWIEERDVRLEIYHRISNLKSILELDEIHDELFERFGKFPDEVSRLFEVTRIRIRARQLKIALLRVSGKKLWIRLIPGEYKFPEKLLAIPTIIFNDNYDFSVEVSVSWEESSKYIEQILSCLETSFLDKDLT
tara:strand:- start:5346 stop:8807 length:3462 start_codon:yes stop_codon:yes gene_type:complete